MQPPKAKVAPALSEALREHVFNEMPIRMLKLPEMVLVERGSVLQHLLDKLAYITPKRYNEMIADTIQWQRLGGESSRDPSSSPRSLRDEGTRKQREIDMLYQNMEGLTRRHAWAKFTFLVDDETIAEEDIQEARDFLVHKIVGEHAVYAILSHTWLEDYPEVTYKDRVKEKRWNVITSKGDPGYRKLFWFCKTVYEEARMEFAWMDTICINKDSTSELEESIRSMYRWYESSKICFSYLADTDSLEDMERDRWFTRGWTLQELLAPERMKFYNRDWMPLSIHTNDKSSVEIISIIEKVTNIDGPSIASFRPGIGRGVAHKMAWAATRRTTKAEDRSYCLMGIFGVSFSIAYGEGQERAFLRLIEAILTTFPNCYDIFNFAGDPIDSNIHTSNIIPSSPECYSKHNHDLGLYNLFPRQPLTLTHIGLRIPLLIVIATCDTEYESEFGDQKFVCVDIHGWRTDPVVCHIDNSEVASFNPLTDHFGFAIWNFEELPGNTIQIPSLCAIFLLDLQYAPQGSHATGWSRHIALDSINPGSKIDTEEVLIMHQSGLDLPVEKRRLGEYGITYSSVYL